MAQPFCELSNPGASISPVGSSPWFNKPFTPDRLHIGDSLGGDGDPVIGKGTRYQLPNGSFKAMIVRGWKWIYGTASIDVIVTPELLTGTGGDVSVVGPVTLSVGLNLGIDPAPTPGVDLTSGFGGYPLTKTYDAWAEDAVAYTVGHFSNLTVSGGIDTAYISPKLTVKLGENPIYTVHVNTDGDDADADEGTLYWMDNFELTLEWTLLISGPGLPDREPEPLPAIPVQPGTWPIDDDSDGIKQPQTLTTFFDLVTDYSSEGEVVVSDDVATTVESHNPIIRSMGGSEFSQVVTSGNAHINITKYAAVRATM